MPHSKFKNVKKYQASCQAIFCQKPFLILLATVLFVTNITFYLNATTFKNSDCQRGIRPLDFLPAQKNNCTVSSDLVDFSQSVIDPRVLSGAGRFDSTRRYQIYDFAYVGERWSHLSGSQNLCLATHASADQLFRLVELAETWQGLISLALFVPQESYRASVMYFHYLSRCFYSVRENVSLHLVFPLQDQPFAADDSSTNWEWMHADCHAWEESTFKDEMMKTMRGWNMSYPQNHLRNVARKGCPTPYVFLLDIDIIPRAHLAQQLEHFLTKNAECEKCAFVVPAFEILENIMSLPKDKKALKRLVKSRKAQYYHKKVFAMNQGASNPVTWLRIADTKEIEIAYPVKKFPFFYEPFYVAKDDEVPAHDERFVGYGFTRNTQTYEMKVAGYHFQILNSAFALHRGLKKEPIKDAQRNEETLRNSKLLDQFKREIYARYNYHQSPTKSTKKQNTTMRESVHYNNETIK